MEFNFVNYLAMSIIIVKALSMYNPIHVKGLLLPLWVA